MKRLVSVLFAAGLAAAASAQTLEFGNLSVTQFNFNNNPTDIAVTVAPGSTANVSVVPALTNRGDYAVRFGNAYDPAAGIMISSVRQNSRDDSATGNTISVPFQATSATSVDTDGYFVSLFHASNGGEVNMDVSVAFFPYARYLGGIASNATNNTALNSIVASPGIALGAGLQFQTTSTAGQYLLNLTGLGASSANGILLVSGGKNEDNFALSRPNADGTFTLWCKDNDANTTGYEADPVAFVYLPVSGVGSDSLAALGRVNNNATTDIAAGAFTVTKGPTGTWYLTIPGQSPSTGTLLVSAEWGGATQGNMLDNIVSAEWDAAGARWVVQSRDLTNATTAPVLQDGATAGEDVFSFAFFTTSGINQPPTVSLTAPVSGSSHALGAPLVLGASAADTDGTIAKVEFFDGATKLGEDTDAPYSIEVTSLPLGLRSLTARATDSGGAVATSAAAALTVQPPVGAGALFFDGVDDHVTFGNNPALGLESFTLELWFLRAGAGVGASSGSGGITAEPLITKGRGEGDGSNIDCNYFFGIQTSSGKLAADFEDLDTGLNHPVVGSTVIPNGVWQHAAVTFDAATFEWRIYLNGGLEVVASTGGEVPRADSIQHAAIATALNSLGVREGAFFGLIDEVRIWNSARSQAEIQQAINQQLVTAPGLVARWAMSEGTGTTIANSAGQEITGTLGNGPAWTAGAPFDANIAPSIALSAPAGGTSVFAPATFSLEAIANDGDGSIARVEFLRDGVVVATDTEAPYVLAQSALGAGIYSYTARATDNLGVSAVTAPVVMNVAFDPLNPPANTALRFDGVDDYVTMGAAPELGLGGPPNNGLTIECWFRKEGAGITSGSGSGGVTGVPLFGKGRGESDGGTQDCDYFFGINAAGQLVADFETYPATGLTAGQNYPVTATNAPIVNGTWYHAAATYDGATATWKLYLDGVQVGTAAAAAGARPRFDSLQHFGIATALTTTGAREGAFAGRIDEVRLWNYARSAAEILAAKDVEISAAPGLVARYGLNEAAGTAVGNSAAVDGAPAGAFFSAPVWVEGAPFASVNTAPSVALVAPAPAASGVYPYAVTFTAEAQDSDGVARVEFYVNNSKVGEDAAAPYVFAWTPPAVGTYSVVARAIDALGAAATSAPVALEITPNPNQPPVVTPAGPADGANGIGVATTLSVGIADPEGDGATVTFYGRKTVPATPGPDFTLVTLPDTQYYSQNTGGTRFAQFLAQTNWIVAQKDARRVAFVSHMGDIVENGDSIPQQWVNANEAMSVLESHATTLRAYGIPFGAAPGNHDQASIGNPETPSAYFNQYFGTARYAGRPYWGGNYGANNDNNYQLFSASGLDFIILHLEYRTAADPAVIAWADALLKAYPHRRAIVTSHWIIGGGNPAAFGGQGQQIYDGLKNNPNLFLLLCGHIHAEGRRSDTFEGRTVYSVLQDYQGTANGGNGFLRYFTFSPANNTITAESYSPSLGRAPNASDSIPGFSGTFTLPYDMQSSVSGWIPLGTAIVAPGASTASLDWTGLEKSSHYEWYASVDDGINVARGAARRFSTAAAAEPSVALSVAATLDIDDPVTLTATATDADGTIARVDFFQGNVKVGSDVAAPYELTLPALALGSYTFTATAVDNDTNAALSAPAALTVVQHVNDAPSVALTSPAVGSRYLAPSDIALTASAADSDGTVTKVEFFNGTTKLGEATAAPYAFTLTAAPAGDYTLTAVATDDQGAQTTSAPVTITLVAPLQAAQNFDSMAATTAAPAGWSVYGVFGGSNATWTNTTGIPATTIGGGTLNNTLIAATTFTGTSNTQGYNFALAASTADRALGTSPTSGAGVALQLTLTNTTGLAITAINVAYDIRRFTAPATANELPGYQLFYSVDNGAWVNVAALNPTLAGPTGVIVPNTVGVTSVPATLVTLASRWSAGATLRLRWVDDNATQTSPDQVVGLDNVSVTSAAGEPTLGAPPSVALTSPAAAASYLNTDTIPLAATATDADGTVTRVEFYDGTTKLGEDLSAPFTYAASGLAVGSHTFTAVATDDAGNIATSAPVAITVTFAPGSSGNLVRGPYLNLATPTSIVVRWRSSQATIGRVRYGLTPTSLTEVANETAATVDHEVKLTGLTPYTRYYYSVGSAVDTLTPEAVDTTSVRTAYTIPAPTAADYTFRTSPAAGTPVDTRIWVVGDCGRGSATQAAGRDAYYAWMGNRVPDLNLQLGDNAYNSGTDAEYQSGYFLMYPTIFRKMPQWSTLGNHDANNGNTDPTQNWPYFDMFTFPTAGEAGGVASGTEHYYSFDYGHIHFICLDSQTSLASTSATAPQTVWLKNDLASTTATWIIVFFHHPPYSKGSHDSDTESQMVRMRQVYGPILEAGGVDLVLTGHSHNYERSVLLDGHYGITSTITPAMKLNAGNGSVTGFTTSASGVIRNAANNFTATATVGGTVIPPDGAYVKPLTGPRDHFGVVYNTAGMSGQADGGSLNHTAMYISYNLVGTVNLDVSGNTLTATFIQSNGAAPDNYTIVKRGAADSDADGLPDEFEIAAGLDRKNAADADLDLDGDGLSNRLEYALGTAANVAGRTGIPVLGTDAGKLTLTFTRARSELTYTVQASDDLRSWTDLSPANPGNVGESVTVTDLASASATRYLRLRIADAVKAVTTTPVGRITYTLPAGQDTALSFPLDPFLGPITGAPAGFIGAVGANTLDRSGAGWTPGALSHAATPYFVRITSGAAAGRVFAVATTVAGQNTAERLTLNTAGVDLTTLGIVAGVDTFELFPADTLATLFPDGVVKAGTTTTGDTFRLWNGSLWITYFFDGATWQRSGAGTAGNTLVRPDQGWMFYRRGLATTFTLYGTVPSARAAVVVPRGATSYVSLLPVPQTFAEFSLQTALPGWSSNPANVTAGDHVRLWNGSLWLTYYYDGANWLRQGAGVSDTVPLIRAGRPFFIVRPAGTGADVLKQDKTY